jgi:hypothetical protein
MTRMTQETCFKCKSSILLEHQVLKFDCNLYHTDCFTCANCDVPLGGIKFIRDSKHGRICLECDDKLSIKCKKCNKSFKPGQVYKRITGKNNDDECYHTECFACASCEKCIFGEFYDCQGSIVCLDCQKIKDAELSKLCTYCNQIIKYRFIMYKNEPYHQQCFKCKGCETPIESASFYKIDENEPICKICNQTHLESTANKCAKCTHSILDVGVQLENLHFHSTCLRCMSCENMLENTVFTHEQETYCENCYTKKYGKKCAKCGQSLSRGDTCAVFDDKYFHKMCFVCGQCGKELAGVQFVKRDTNLVCIECK